MKQLIINFFNHKFVVKFQKLFETEKPIWINCRDSKIKSKQNKIVVSWFILKKKTLKTIIKSKKN